MKQIFAGERRQSSSKRGTNFSEKQERIFVGKRCELEREAIPCWKERLNSRRGGIRFKEGAEKIWLLREEERIWLLGGRRGFGSLKRGEDFAFRREERIWFLGGKRGLGSHEARKDLALGREERI